MQAPLLNFRIDRAKCCVHQPNDERSMKSIIEVIISKLT
jgi:hypothetical protein